MNAIATRVETRLVRAHGIAAILTLFVAVLFGTLAATELLLPDMMRDAPWLTWGRVRYGHTQGILFGWLGNAFIPEAAEVFLTPLREGAEHASRTLDQLDLVAPVAVEFHDDQAAADAAARRHADGYAFTIGAMGVGGKNFYNDAFTRLGYGTEVDTVAGLWQAGKHDEARSAVPLDLGRLTNLLGTPDTIADRVKRYRAAGITTLLAKLDGDHEQQLATLQRLVAIAQTVEIMHRRTPYKGSQTRTRAKSTEREVCSVPSRHGEC